MTHENEALNTLAASWFTIRLAILFGEKEVRDDIVGRVTIRHWRGKRYLTDYQGYAE